MKQTIKIIFTLSLLLNIALIGVVLGGVYKRHQWHKPQIELSEKSQEILKQNMKDNRAQMKESFSQMRTDKEDLQKAIAADVFDRDAYDQVVAKILNHKNDFSRIKAESMGDVLSKLSLEERQKISKRLAHGIIGGKKGGHKAKVKDGKERFKRFSDRQHGRPE